MPSNNQSAKEKEAKKAKLNKDKDKVESRIKKRTALKNASRSAVTRQRGLETPESTPDVEQNRVDADKAQLMKNGAETALKDASQNLEEAKKLLESAATDEEKQAAEDNVKAATEKLEVAQREKAQADVVLEQILSPADFESVLTEQIKRILDCDDDDYYAVLDVDQDATSVEISNGWLALGCALHPDYCKIPKAEQAFQKLKNSAEKLGVDQDKIANVVKWKGDPLDDLMDEGDLPAPDVDTPSENVSTSKDVSTSSGIVYPWSTHVTGNGERIIGIRKRGTGHQVLVEYSENGVWIRKLKSASEVGFEALKQYQNLKNPLYINVKMQEISVNDRSHFKELLWITKSEERFQDPSKRPTAPAADCCVQFSGDEFGNNGGIRILTFSKFKAVRTKGDAISDVTRVCQRDGIKPPWECINKLQQTTTTTATDGSNKKPLILETGMTELVDLVQTLVLNVAAVSKDNQSVLTSLKSLMESMNTDREDNKRRFQDLESKLASLEAAQKNAK